MRPGGVERPEPRPLRGERPEVRGVVGKGEVVESVARIAQGITTFGQAGDAPEEQGPAPCPTPKKSPNTVGTREDAVKGGEALPKSSTKPEPSAAGFAIIPTA